MEYYAAIKMKTFESVLMKWMILEPIMQSEVMHTYGIWKDGTDEPILGAAIQMQT